MGVTITGTIDNPQANTQLMKKNITPCVNAYPLITRTLLATMSCRHGAVIRPCLHHLRKMVKISMLDLSSKELRDLGAGRSSEPGQKAIDYLLLFDNGEPRKGNIAYKIGSHTSLDVYPCKQGVRGNFGGAIRTTRRVRPP